MRNGSLPLREGGIMDYKAEFIKILGKNYLNLNNKITKEYSLNEKKAYKMLKLTNFCEALVSRNGGSFECIVTDKIDQPAEIQLRFVNDLVFGEETNSIEELSNALELCDGINIGGTGLEDGSFLISFFIENLYVKK